MHGHLERDLDDKDGEHHEVQCLQQSAVPGDEVSTRLQSCEQAREENHSPDHPLKPAGADQSVQFRIHEAGALIPD